MYNNYTQIFVLLRSSTNPSYRPYCTTFLILSYSIRILLSIVGASTVIDILWALELVGIELEDSASSDLEPIFIVYSTGYLRLHLYLLKT